MQIIALYRHPIKSHGREEIESVALVAGQSMPFDRLWALAHEASKAVEGEWARCMNFCRIAGAPKLMAITAQMEGEDRVTLRHPDRPDLTFAPDTGGAALIEWVGPLMEEGRARPDHVMRLDGHGYPDSDFPSVTLCNLASHRAVEGVLEQSLSPHRWRGNLWFDSEVPWVEFDWMGRELQIGDAVLRPVERTDRCIATTANPDTGTRDADILGALGHFGHEDFSVRCEVLKGGKIARGDVILPL